MIWESFCTKIKIYRCMLWHWLKKIGKSVNQQKSLHVYQFNTTHGRTRAHLKQQDSSSKQHILQRRNLMNCETIIRYLINVIACPPPNIVPCAHGDHRATKRELIKHLINETVFTVSRADRLRTWQVSGVQLKSKQQPTVRLLARVMKARA